MIKELFLVKNNNNNALLNLGFIKKNQNVNATGKKTQVIKPKYWKKAESIKIAVSRDAMVEHS